MRSEARHRPDIAVAMALRAAGAGCAVLLADAGGLRGNFRHYRDRHRGADGHGRHYLVRAGDVHGLRRLRHRVADNPSRVVALANAAGRDGGGRACVAGDRRSHAAAVRALPGTGHDRVERGVLLRVRQSGCAGAQRRNLRHSAAAHRQHGAAGQPVLLPGGVDRGRYRVPADAQSAGQPDWPRHPCPAWRRGGGFVLWSRACGDADAGLCLRGRAGWAGGLALRAYAALGEPHAVRVESGDRVSAAGGGWRPREVAGRRAGGAGADSGK